MKKIVIKTCKKCNKKRYANTTLCYSHHLEKERLKREEKARLKKERKEGTKKFQKKLRKTLMDKAWRLMSEYVRTKHMDRYGYVTCYTCGKKIEYKKIHCGHLFHGKLNFDERNLRPQCYTCNVGNSGQREIYMLKRINEDGIEAMNQLEKDAWAKGNNYSIEELGKIIKDLKIKIEKLNG